ncbi:MAG: phosphoribosylformylglycinamidine synthase I [Candidatus Omnitrophota bacterium]
MLIRKKPRVLVIRTAGTNCDIETSFAFEASGAVAERVHINRLISGEKKVGDYSIIAIPGGFSYGDDIASGKILANEIKYKLGGDIRRFILSGRPIIGICNGFQVLVKSGFLPNAGGGFRTAEATLSLNDSAKFEDRWVYLKHEHGPGGASACIWTRGIERVIALPVAHAEGKFITADNGVMRSLEKNRQIVFRYTGAEGLPGPYPVNPNGSAGDVAGVCDPSGTVFGLMPHPERHIQFTQHPFWTKTGKTGEGDGLAIFRNGVVFAKSL